MLFEEALEVMRYDGARVKRNKWTSAYLFLSGDDLFLGREGSSKYYKVKSIDVKSIVSDEWEVYDV